MGYSGRNLDPGSHDCKHPVEVCLNFDDLGYYIVHVGLVCEITKTESFIPERREETDDRGRKARFNACIVLFKYILMCPDSPPEVGEWTAYRDFKNAAPLIHYFAANAENAVAKTFSGRIDALRQAAESLKGRAPVEALSYDLALSFDALPRVPLLMLFNDAEEGFEARCSILFRRSVESYLDMECLGILGAQLAGYLNVARNGKFRVKREICPGTAL